MVSLRIVGIHDNHNASVCLLEDGVLKFAVEEERLIREKNYSGFPYKGLQTLLKYNDLTLEDIDFFAFNFKYNPTQYTKAKLLEWYAESGTLESKAVEIFRRSPFFSLYKNRARKVRLKQIENAGIPQKKVVFIDHHLAHACAAYYGSSYDKYNEKVLVLTLDGGGDGLCSTIYVGENGSLAKIAQTKEGHSIGNIYARTTFYMGMTPLEHEYKLMGMAPYAKKEYYAETYGKLRSLLVVDGLTFKRRTWFSTFECYPYLKKTFERERFDNVTGALQDFTEDLTLEWVKNAIKKTGIGSLALGGGSFMNVKANKRIMELDEVKNLFVFPSCGDESCAIGAAFEVYSRMCKDSGTEIRTRITDLYKGPDYSDNEIEAELKKASQSNRIDYSRSKEVEKWVAEMLARNEAVARFNGRVEFGARALGNRSILANGSDFLNVRFLNEAVKQRDFWMPFAPSILKEAQHDYLVNPKNVEAPYMILAFDSTEKRKDIIAAIHPADQSARPQVVSTDFSPEYHHLLKRYEQLTEYGGLLNTSFNLHGEPIVCSPKDALHTFINSGLKYLAIGDYLVSKKRLD